MLIQFNFENFRSFQDKATLDFTATRQKDHKDHIFAAGRERILPIAGIFGSNASGKSNVLQAFTFMTDYVLHSLALGGPKPVLRQGAALTDWVSYLPGSDRETFFEVFFTIPTDERERSWNYGFALTDKGVHEEWLNVTAKTSKQSRNIFYQDNYDHLEMPGIKKPQKDGLEAALNRETLLVSLGARLRVNILEDIFQWFAESILSTDFDDPAENLFLSTMLPAGFGDSENVQMKVLQYLGSFDDSIVGFETEKSHENDEGRGNITIYTKHKTSDGTSFRLPLAEEAAGTLKMLALYTPLQAVLDTGGLLLIDELNSKLHPLLVRAFLQCFLDPVRNPKHAQLLFTSHDVWMLNAGLLRRDEIWFAEKNRDGSSAIHSLAEFRSAEGRAIREDENYMKNYLAGRYGGIPELQPIHIGTLQ